MIKNKFVAISSDVWAISPVQHQTACQSFSGKLFSLVGSKLVDISYQTQHVFNVSINHISIIFTKKIKADVIAMSSHNGANNSSILFGSHIHRVIVGKKYQF
jgi:hypothetical protein